jgi:hypothetical protein
VAWIPSRFLPAGQRQITSINTCFIRHCPNQSEHHATLPKIILKYPSLFKTTSAEARILCRMHFLTQPSSFPGLGLAPPMALITVEAGDLYNSINYLRQQYVILILSSSLQQLLECRSAQGEQKRQLCAAFERATKTNATTMRSLKMEPIPLIGS